MKVLITGSKGQLGRALINIQPLNTEIFAMDRKNFNMLNIEDCLAQIRFIKPDWIINCGAYTNVELAETEKEIAMKINYEAPARFAEEIKKQNGKVLTSALNLFSQMENGIKDNLNKEEDDW